MNIKELIKNELPDFRGIVVADGAADLDALKKFKATLAWKFNRERACNFDKVLIAGNINNSKYKNKGNYFIADITDIITVRELVQLSSYSEIINYQNEKYNNWIERQINTQNNISNLGIDTRNAILFENPTNTKKFSISNFNFLSNPVTYII